MELLIDVQALQSPNTRRRGIDRYARNLAAALAAARPGRRVGLVQSAHLDPIDPARLEGLPLATFRPPLADRPENAEANERYYADWLTAGRPDAVLLASPFDERVLVPRFTGRRPALYAVLYDLIPLLFHATYLRNSADLALYASRFRRLLGADAVLCISEATAHDLRKLAGEQAPRLANVGGAPDPSFTPCPDAELPRFRDYFRTKFGLGREFFLYVGGFDFRKNLRGALAAYAALPETIRQQFDLVIACQLTDGQRDALGDWCRELGVAEDVKLTGFVSDEELRALYGLCRLFLFPSLYEGLGLPVLEALHGGTPVVASDRSSVPEAAGPVSWLADPGSPRATAEAIATALAEPRDARRAERLAFVSQFNWTRTAARAWDVMEQTRTPCLPRRNASRRRLAWLSPLPPAASGIADYSAELLERLAEHYDIELVVNPAEPLIARGLTRRHRVLAVHEVPARHEASPFDLFVSHVGNSHHHVYMLDLLRRYRGLVVLHDFYLGGLVLPAVLTGAWPGTLADEVEYEGEARLARLLRAERITAATVLDRVALNRRILALADAVIVHSAWSWRRVRALISAPVARVPHAAPVPELGSRDAERRRLGLPAGAFLIASLGFVGPPKRLPALVRAVAALPPPARADAQVLIVGHATAEQQADLLALANSLGVAGAVAFTGRVPFSDFAAYARAANVCVQLRYPTRGETSGALLRELGTGAACVVSDHGSIAEVPDGVALKVRTPDHEIEDLTAALLRLYQAPGLRAELGAAAVRYVREEHAMAAVVRRYAAMIELTIARRAGESAEWLEGVGNALADGTDVPPDLAQRWAALRAAG